VNTEPLCLKISPQSQSQSESESYEFHVFTSRWTLFIDHLLFLILLSSPTRCGGVCTALLRRRRSTAFGSKR